MSRLYSETEELYTEQERAEDLKYMEQALELARRAAEGGDVPIGCVIVHGGQVIGTGYNRRNQDHSVLAHAEILAIREATEAMGDWRLEECTMYVTLEPCQMCAGAIVQARIPQVIMAAESPKSGCGGTILDILNNPEFNHQVEVKRGVLKEECQKLLKDFFVELRIRNKAEKEAERNS